MQTNFEEIADGFVSLRATLERLNETVERVTKAVECLSESVDRFLRGLKQRREAEWR